MDLLLVLALIPAVEDCCSDWLDGDVRHAIEI
jgi:hypothetical protein